MAVSVWAWREWTSNAFLAGAIQSAARSDHRGDEQRSSEWVIFRLGHVD
jgi:hypothetical protein